MKRLIALLGWLAALAPQAAAAEAYKIAMLPRYFPERLTTMMTPLTGYLREQTGLDVEMVLTKDFADYEKRLKAGEIALGYQNPLVYTRVAPRHQAVAVAKEGGDFQFRGIVVARPDSGIKALADLAGRRVMMVGETSAGGYLSQRLSLLEQRIPLAGITVETAADNRQENVIIAVSIGDVDAGFVREDALHVADKYIAPGSVAKVTETAWLPSWAFSLDQGLPAEVRAKLGAALLRLEAGHPALKALELEGIKAATDADYDGVRKALAGP